MVYQLHHNYICQESDSQRLNYPVPVIKEILLTYITGLIKYALIAYAGATVY